MVAGVAARSVSAGGARGDDTGYGVGNSVHGESLWPRRGLAKVVLWLLDLDKSLVCTRCLWLELLAKC